MTRYPAPSQLATAVAWQASFDEPKIADLRFRRDVETVYRLGPRAVAELLAEIGAERSIQTLIEQKTASYAAIDPHALAELGGDRFPLRPLIVVTGGKEVA